MTENLFIVLSDAIENIESILSQPNAFKQKYHEVGDVDDTKIPECAEDFITLLMVITGLYMRDCRKRALFRRLACLFLFPLFPFE